MTSPAERLQSPEHEIGNADIARLVVGDSVRISYQEGRGGDEELQAALMLLEGPHGEEWATGIYQKYVGLLGENLPDPRLSTGSVIRTHVRGVHAAVITQLKDFLALPSEKKEEYRRMLTPLNSPQARR